MLRYAPIFGLAALPLQAEELHIVTDIAPIQSLVAMVGGEDVHVEALMPPGGDPHGLSLRPSQARAVADADMVVWIGPSLSPALEETLEALAADTPLLTLSALDGLTELESRELEDFGHAHEDHGHGQDDHDDHAEDKHDDHGHDDHGHDDHGHDDHAEDKHDDHGHAEHGHDDHDDHAEDKHDDHGHEEHADHDDHGHGEHGFEWAGLFDLAPGSYSWTFAKVDGDYADPAMKMVILAAADIEAAEEEAEHLLEDATAMAKADGDALTAQEAAYALTFDDAKPVTTFTVDITEPGTYAVFTEHMPFEFEADAHFFKDSSGADVEPVAQEPEMDGHDHGHGHDDHAGHDDHDDHHDHDHGGTDPHLWLSLDNAEVWIEEIAHELAHLAPNHADAFEANAQNALAILAQTRADAAQIVAPAQGLALAVYHDSYQYFEAEFGLINLGAITNTDAVDAGPATLAALRDKLAAETPDCMLAEPGFKEGLIEAVEAGDTKQVTVDPLGAHIPSGAAFYPALIRDIATQIASCAE